MDASDYRLLTEQAISLIESESDLTANLANISGLLNEALEDINWVGFYILKEGVLVLGPFQGKPACTRISLNKGVCGKAFTTSTALLVNDVSVHEGHISCDANSQSELVIPFNVSNELFGVLDIDSPTIARFKESDKQELSKFMAQVGAYL